MQENIAILSRKISAQLNQRNLRLVTAESCTGGLLAAAITEIPGASNYFERGFIVYNNAAKIELLGVKTETLQSFGAVSEEAAIEMVSGAAAGCKTRIGIAITGIAGPATGNDSKPVGTICFAWRIGETIQSEQKQFNGDRKSIRLQAVRFALQKLNHILENFG